MGLFSSTGARLLRWTFTGRDFIPLNTPWNGQPPSTVYDTETIHSWFTTNLTSALHNWLPFSLIYYNVILNSHYFDIIVAGRCMSKFGWITLPTNTRFHVARINKLIPRSSLLSTWSALFRPSCSFYGIIRLRAFPPMTKKHAPQT